MNDPIYTEQQEQAKPLVKFKTEYIPSKPFKLKASKLNLIEQRQKAKEILNIKSREH